MAALVRFLLWTLVVLAPGGVLLLPLLAADALRSKAKAASSTELPAGPLPDAAVTDAERMRA